MSLMIVMVLIYVGITLAIGFWAGRNAGSSYASFHLADRDLNLPVYTMTYMATFTGGGLVMGLAALAYTSGISAQWYAMTEGLAMITVVALVGFMRKFHVSSIGELIGRVYGKTSRSLTAFINVLGNLALTAGQTIGMASVITVLTGLPLVYSFWLSAFVFIATTMYGGMKSVAWMDTFQGLVLMVGIFVLIPYAVVRSGGLSTITADLPEQSLNWVGIGLLQIITWYLMYVFVVGAGQMLLQRVWAARSTSTARWGTFLAGLVVTFVGLFTAAAGLLALALGPADLEPSLAFAWTIANTLPPIAAALLLAAAVSALMTGANSFLLAAGTSFVNDIYLPIQERRGRECSRREAIMASRLSVGLLGVLAALIALSGMNIVPINTIGMGLMGAPVFIGLLMMFFPGTRVRTFATALLASAGTFGVWEFVLGEPYGVESAVPAALVMALVMYGLSRTSLGGPEIDLKGILDAEDVRRTHESRSAANKHSTERVQ